MHKKMRIKELPGDWRDRVLILWEEDDVDYPDKEETGTAFKRITLEHEQPFCTVDDGDTFYDFYRRGWVKCTSYDGGFVGVLVAGDGGDR